MINSDVGLGIALGTVFYSFVISAGASSVCILRKAISVK